MYFSLFKLNYETVKQNGAKIELLSDFLQDYLTRLHDLHESWLIRQTQFTLPCPVLTLDANEEAEEMIKVYDSHRERILGGYV